MKQRKKLLSLLLTASMALGMAVPSFAARENIVPFSAELDVVGDSASDETVSGGTVSGGTVSGGTVSDSSSSYSSGSDSSSDASGGIDTSTDVTPSADSSADKSTDSDDEADSTSDKVTIKKSIPADIVFVLDKTSSMRDDIEHVRDNIKSFVNKLENLSRQDGTKVDPRVSIVEFGDVTSTEASKIWSLDESTKIHTFGGSNWSGNGDELYDALDSIEECWGGDIDETASEALEKLLDSSYGWRDDSQKFVFLITDADYKDENDKTATAVHPIPDMQEVADGLHRMGITVSTVISKKVYDNRFKKLYNENGGVCYDIKGDLDFMTDIMKKIEDLVLNPIVSLHAEDFGDISLEYVSAAGEDRTATTSIGHKTMSSEVEADSDAKFTVTPESGYEIDKVYVNGVEETVSGDDIYVGTLTKIQINKTITATFKKLTECTVSVNAGNGGSVDKLGTNTVTQKSSFTVTATPDSGYAVGTFTVTIMKPNGTVEREEHKAGESADTATESRSLTIKVIGDTVIDVDFVITDHIITVEGAQNGTIRYRRYIGKSAVDGQDPTDYEYDDRIAGVGDGYMTSVPVRVAKDSEPFFEISPHNGYFVKDVLVDGVVDEEYHNRSMAELTHDGLVNDNGSIYKIFPPIDGNHTLSAIFAEEDEDSYVVTAQANGQGTIEFEGQEAVRKNSTTMTVSENAEITVIMKPDQPGFLLDVRDNDTSVISSCVSENNVYRYTVNVGAVNHTIIATFEPEEEKVYEIEAEADDDGTIDPDGLVSVSANHDMTFTIRPDSDCMLADVLVDNVSVMEKPELVKISGNEVKYEYTFKNVTSDHTIYATFAERIPGTDGTDDYYVYWTKKVPYDGRKHDRMGVKQASKKVAPDIEVKVFSYDGTKRTDVSDFIKKVTFRNQKKAAKTDTGKAPYFQVKMAKGSPLNANELKSLKKTKFKFEIEPATLSANLINETHKTGNNGVKLTLEYKIPNADKTDSGFKCKMKYTKNGTKTDYTYTQPDANGYVTVTGQNNFEGEVKIKVS